MLIILRPDVFSFKVMDSSCTVNIQMHYVKPRRKGKHSPTSLNETNFEGSSIEYKKIAKRKSYLHEI